MLSDALERHARVGRILKDVLSSKEGPTPSESKEHGKQLREEVPFEAHAAWLAPDSRTDPVELLLSQDETRVPSLVSLRHERMAVSPFTFYRGAALVMASDLSHTPSTGLMVQACGDAHIANFGMFRSPEGRTVFDINDFDETAPSPWEWDLKRLVTSVEICGRDRGFSAKDRKTAVRMCAQSYRTSMLGFAKMGHLDVWHDHIDLDELFDLLTEDASKDEREDAKRALNKMRGKNSLRAAEKFTEVVDGHLRFKSIPPTLIPWREIESSTSFGSFLGSEGAERLLTLGMAEYRDTLSPETRQVMRLYHGSDIAHKVVGVGSVGTRALVMVLEGASLKDPLVLQLKEAGESVLERFCERDDRKHHGRRVVEGQKALQAVSDALLGWCTLPDENGKPRDFYVRQLWNGKGSFDLTTISEERLAGLAAMCGWTLAHAHARTGDRFAIAGYLGKKSGFDHAMVKFARAYADQNEADFQRFVQAVSDSDKQ